MNDKIPERTCGDCVACCAYWRIEELNKPPMNDCKYVTLTKPSKKGSIFLTGSSKNGNCSIYNKRPKACQEYRCAWLDGYGEEEDRPDKSLIMFDNKHNIENAYQARPLAPGQESVIKGKEVIERMSKSLNTPIIVMSFYERLFVRIVGRAIEDA